MANEGKVVVWQWSDGSHVGSVRVPPGGFPPREQRLDRWAGRTCLWERCGRAEPGVLPPGRCVWVWGGGYYAYVRPMLEGETLADVLIDYEMWRGHIQQARVYQDGVWVD
jgi:hypothetical protein